FRSPPVHPRTHPQYPQNPPTGPHGRAGSGLWGFWGCIAPPPRRRPRSARRATGGASMTPEDRRARGTVLCERLTREVAELVPGGIGAWSPAWTIVAPADAAFMEALTRWEASGDETHKAP